MTAAQWMEVIVSYSLQVLVVISIGRVLERVVPRTGDRCAVWHTCFFCILILGCAAIVLPRLHLIQPWSRVEAQTLLTVSTAQGVIGRVLLAVWCLGASVSLIRWAHQGVALRRTMRRCEQLSESEVRRLLGLTNIATHQRHLPVVLISDNVDGPFCWQFHQPTVLLPRFLLQGDGEDLRHVLLHELEHLKTNHPLQLFLQRLVQVICWFHPAVWNAAARASLAREFTCDEVAANHGADCAAYLRTLLNIAERCEQRNTSSVVNFGRSPSEIVLRARRLVHLSNRNQLARRCGWFGRRTAKFTCVIVTALVALLWIPTDPLASSRSVWSPWPKWTAKSLHCFGYRVRDYEQYDRRSHVYEIREKRNHAALQFSPTRKFTKTE
jgi:beta-lactamase regulating signal transducer with metallopeptidase domain